MKQNIEEYINSHISKADKTMDVVSSYSINRKAAKSFQLVIFWAVKGTKGEQSRIHIPLDSSRENAKLVMDVMEDMIEKVDMKTLDERMKETKIEPKGWGE